MVGLRRWKGELLESEHRRLFVCLHPANKVALNYETAYGVVLGVYVTRLTIYVFSYSYTSVSYLYLPGI